MKRSLLSGVAFEETRPRVLLTLLGLSIAGCSGQMPSGSEFGGGHKTGHIYVVPLGMPGTFFASGFAATFPEMLVPGTPVPQTTLLDIDSRAGDCNVTQLTTPTTGHYTAPVFARVSAGTIALVNGQQSAFLVPQLQLLADGGSSVHYALSPDSMGFVPGDALTITASGGTVPPFSAEITVPNAVTLTQPDLRASSVAVVRSMDFPVTWTGGGPAGDVTFGFTQEVGETTTNVSCSFPATAGRGVIPASALRYLKATSELSSAPRDGTAFGLGSTSVTHVIVQDWDIRVVAEPPDFVESSATVE